MVTFFTGDLLSRIQAGQLAGPTLLLHVVNTRGGWGAGFSGALSQFDPRPERAYRRWKRPELGMVQPVTLSPLLTVANCCAQLGYSTPLVPAFRIGSFQMCLHKLVARYPEHTYLMPRVGAGLGGARWDDIERCITDTLADIQIAEVWTLPR
jgi:hypothetical protein